MASFQTDENNGEVLLFRNNEQVMMEWEKPYMEASIDMLQPRGDVLEVGFGCAYSATQIIKHKPKSYTVIECDPNVLEKARIWREQYPSVPITIVEGRWQEKLSTLGIFDEIYFDDYPLEIDGNCSKLEILMSSKRLDIFLDICIQQHTRVGSKICFYLNGNTAPVFSSDTTPFIDYISKTVDIQIPDNCKYRNLKEQKCIIPVITKIKEYDFQVAQRLALEQIMSAGTGEI